MEPQLPDPDKDYRRIAAEFWAKLEGFMIAFARFIVEWAARNPKKMLAFLLFEFLVHMKFVEALTQLKGILDLIPFVG